MNSGGAVTLDNSTLYGNATGQGVGGGIYSSGGSLSLTDSTVSDNVGDSTGAGTDPQSGGTGGIYDTGTLTLTGSTVSGNVGGRPDPWRRHRHHELGDDHRQHGVGQQ